jgi:scytalone dehydratase
MPASEFVQMMSSPGFLGDPLIRTQHFVGATKWRKVDVDRIEGHHQIRSTHHRFDTPPVGDNSEGKRSSVAAKSHVLAIITYVCVNGEWKWGGIKTDIRWHDGKFIDIFRDF